MRTYAIAQNTLLEALAEKGWKLREIDRNTGRRLKVRHATSPDGSMRIYVKSQALYLATNTNGLELAKALSMFVDVRVESPADVVKSAKHMAANWPKDEE